MKKRVVKRLGVEQCWGNKDCRKKWGRGKKTSEKMEEDKERSKKTKNDRRKQREMS